MRACEWSPSVAADRVSAALTAALALAPIAAFVALLAETTVTEQIVSYDFTTVIRLGAPRVCVRYRKRLR